MIEIKPSYLTNKFPAARAYHTLNNYNNHLYIYGGLKLNDLWEYSIDKQQYKLLGNFIELYSHISIIYKYYLIIFSGIDANVNLNNALYIYNIKDNQWLTIDMKNNVSQPPKDQLYTSLSINNDQLLIFDSFNIYQTNIQNVIDNKEIKWKKIIKLKNELEFGFQKMFCCQSKLINCI